MISELAELTFTSMAISRGGAKADERLFGAAETMRRRLKSFFEAPCSFRTSLTFQRHAMIYNRHLTSCHQSPRSISLSRNWVSTRFHHERWSHDGVVWRCFTLFDANRIRLEMTWLKRACMTRSSPLAFSEPVLAASLIPPLTAVHFSLSKIHWTIKQALPIVIIFLRLHYIQPV